MKRVHRETGAEQWYAGCGEWTPTWRHRFLDDQRPVLGLQEFKRWSPACRIVIVTIRRVVRPRAIRVGDEVMAKSAFYETPIRAIVEWVGDTEARVSADGGRWKSRLALSRLTLAPRQRGGKKKGA